MTCRAEPNATAPICAGGIPPQQIGAVAFGSARQVNDDSTPALMERNRRVDIVVISDKPDVVRALIPQALKLSQK